MRYLDLFINNGQPIIVMECADCGSLYDLLNDEYKEIWYFYDDDIGINWMRQCAQVGLIADTAKQISISAELILFRSHCYF